MPLSLKVPYHEKEQAKQAGAWWSTEQKIWTVPDHIVDLNPFARWLDIKDGFIVRKPYWLLTTARSCWKCGKVTPMVALAAKNLFCYDYPDDEEEPQQWIRADIPTLFSNLTSMSPHLTAYLADHYPLYRRTYSKTQERETWANNCQMCGALQGEWHNHQDFGGAFCPDPYEPLPFGFELKTLPQEMDYYLEGDFSNLNFEDFNLNY